MTGIVPAAGEGLRLRPFRYPKELLPVALEEVDGGLRPVLAIEHALVSLVRGGVTRAIVVVADAKLDLVRLLQTGERLGLDLAYVHQGEALGLGHAVARCVPWLGGGGGLLVMPDTTFGPDVVVGDLVALLGDADVALGVFPTDRPHELGPVLVDGGVVGGERVEGCVVTAVLDKPSPSFEPPANTWGVAAFGPVFGALLARAVAEDPGVVMGAVFDRAIREGLRVRARTWPDARYHDLGTTRGLLELLVRR